MTETRGRRPDPIACAMEIQSSAREVCRLLEFGGHLAERRAGLLAAALVRDSVTLQRHLTPTTKTAA